MRLQKFTKPAAIKLNYLQDKTNLAISQINKQKLWSCPRPIEDRESDKSLKILVFGQILEVLGINDEICWMIAEKVAVYSFLSYPLRK